MADGSGKVDGEKELEALFRTATVASLRPSRSLVLPENGFDRSRRLHRELPPRGAQSQQDQQAAPVHYPLSGAPPNNRGQFAILNPGDVSITVASSPMHVGEDALLMSVLLGFAIPPFIPPTGIVKPPLPVGHALCGIGGATFNFDFDWDQGGILQIPASFIRVNADYGTVYAGFGDFPPIQLAVAFSYNSTGSRVQAAKLTVPFSVLNSSSTTVTIPSFAKRFTIAGFAGGVGHPGPSIQPSLVVQVFSFGTLVGGGIAEYVVNSNTSPQMTEGFFPIPRGATSIFIQNQDPVNSYNGFVIFNLPF